MKYLIGDGIYYLKKDYNGVYQKVKGQFLADSWNEKNKAQNVLENSISKCYKDKFHVIEVGNDEEKKIVKKDRNKVIKKLGEEKIEKNELSGLDITIENLIAIAQKTEERKDYLTNALSEVDKEIVDINHYIETGNKFNAYDGWLVFNMLKNRLKKRREIKNELNILLKLVDCKITTETLNKLKHSIELVKTQKYTPRVLKELFD